MPRRGGGGRPASRQRMAPRPRSPPPPPPKKYPPPPPPRRQGPGLFGQMASTAAGVAVGSAVGHTVGAALTGGGGGRSEVQAASEEYSRYEPTGPCAEEIRQFLKCAEEQADINVCSGFNEAIKNCKQQNNLK